MNNITPITHKNKLYYNRTQLRQLGLSDQEIKDYFELQSIKIVDKHGYVNKLTLATEYNKYIKFKNKFRKQGY